MIKNNQNLLTILTTIFVSLLIISNLIAGRLFALPFNLSLPSAIFVFPLCYTISSVVTEKFGAKIAKRNVILGFLILGFASLIYLLVISLPSPNYYIENNQSYSLVLFSGIRTLIASMIAFVFGNLVNIFILTKLSKKKNENDKLSVKNFGFRYIIGIAIAEIVDSSLFITITFIFLIPTDNLIKMIILQAFTKILINIILMPVVIFFINKINKEN